MMEVLLQNHIHKKNNNNNKKKERESENTQSYDFEYGDLYCKKKANC